VTVDDDVVSGPVAAPNPVAFGRAYTNSPATAPETIASVHLRYRLPRDPVMSSPSAYIVLFRPAEQMPWERNARRNLGHLQLVR
jgi:hypothetical protein